MKVKNLTKKIKVLIVCILTFVVCTLFGVFFGVKDVTKMQTVDAATGHSAHFYIKGASVRVIDDENGHGIRFHVVMSKGMYGAYTDNETGELSKNVTTGTLMIPTKLLGSETLTTETEDVLSVETTDIWFENADGDMESVAYVYNIPAANYRTDLTAVGYVKHGDSETVYTQSVSGFSMAWVASAEINNPNSSLSEEEIVSLKNTYALCSVHYLDQNGAEIKSETVVYGSKITPPEYTVEDGNVFYGWFNKKGNVQWDVENDGVKADVWLYAKEGNPYTLSTRQDIDLQLNDDGSVNTSKTVTLNLSEIGEGWTVTSVAYNGAEIATSATFNVSVFGRDYGEKNLFVTVQKDTETLTYKVPVTLISRIISDRKELLKWPTIAKACETDASLWGGYFTLDANIDVNHHVGWTGGAELLVDMGTGNGSTSGFKGTWDGRGYQLNGLWFVNTGDTKAFVSGLHKDGVIKDLAFINASVGNGSYVVAWGQGTIENVLVQYKYYGNTQSHSSGVYNTTHENGNTATFYSKNQNVTRNIINCVIDMRSEEIYSAKTSSNGSNLIGKVYNYADFQGVYVLGAKSHMQVLQYTPDGGATWIRPTAGDALPAGEVYLYDTVDAWESAGNNECLYNWEQRQLDKLGATKLENSSTDVSETVVLDEKLADLGLSVVDGALVGVDEIRIDLSEIGKYPGSLFTASFNGAKLSGAYIDGKSLVVPATAFDQKGGEGTLNVMTTLGKYEMPLIVASKVIYTVDDYNAFGDVAKLLGAAEGSLIWDGYFALGANLSQTGGIVLNEFIDRNKVSRNGTDGFKGTFNGRGYAIDGLSRTVNTSNAFITALHSDGVLKNIAFTNVIFGSANGSFLCGGGKGKIENVYVQYKEISNGNTSGYGGTVYSVNTSVTSLFVDASACTMTGNGTSFRLIGAVTPSGQSYCLYPANYTAAQAREGGLNSSTVQAFASKAAMLADTTAQGKLASWNNNYWTIVSGVPEFKNVKANGTAYVNVTLSETAAIDLGLTVNAQGELVYSNAQATIDLSAYGVDFGKVVRATYNGNVIAASLKNGVLSIPVAQFGKNHSTQTDTLVVETTNGKITVPVFLYSMVIETVDEYAIWTDVAYALGYDNGGWHYWDGYFALGANLSADGGIALNEGIHRDLVGSASGAAGGFAGTFDGRGYTIDGLTKSGNLKGGFVGVIAGGTLKNIAFTNVVYNGAQGGFISFAGKGTYEDIYVSYASVSGVVAGNYAGTFDVGNSGSTMRRVFISAENTVWDDNSKANFALAGKGNYYGGLFGIDNRLTGADKTSFSGTIGSGWAELIRFQSKAQKGMFATYYKNSASSYSKAINTWLTTCDSWTVVNGIPMMGGKTYTVTFENADGSVLSTQTVARGDMPVAPQLPTMDSNDPFISYTFIGWDKDIVAASGNVTYTAVYVLLSTHSHNYSESYEDNGDGTHTVYCDCGGSVTENHTYQWEVQADKNVQICSLCGNVAGSVLTQLSTAQDINLALTISGGALATRNNAVAIDVSNASALPLTRNSVTYNGQEVVSTATFGHDFGEKNVVVKAATADGYVHTINVPVLLISKVITTRDDISSRATDSFDKIAKLLGEEYNETNGANIWDGYFVLGSNINVNGRGAGKWVGYQGPFMTIEKDQSGASGWKGVFDGRNYTVDSLTVAKNSEERAFISGLHKDGVIKNINFTNAGVGYCSYVVAWGQGTVENVHVQVQGWGVESATATTYTKDYDRKSTAIFFGRAYNTAIGEPQNGNVRRVINCTVDMSSEEYLRAQNSYSQDAFEYGAMFGLSPDDTYENTYVIGADGWMNVLNYWHTFDEAQCNATAGSYVTEYGTWGAYDTKEAMNAAINARGVDEYVIVYDGNSRNARKAAAYLKTQFYNADGIRITALKDAPVAVDGAKYIVLGNEALFNQAGLTLPWIANENTDVNYYAKTDGNNVFLMSRNDDYQPVLYYFLEEVLGYNALGIDLIVFDKEITWDENTAFSVTEKSATAVDERLVGVTMTGNESYSLGFNGEDTFVEGFGMTHNTLKLLPYDTYAATYPEWYSSGTCAIQTEYGGATTNVDVSQESYRQLCFTAHGDAVKYDKMVKTLVDNLLPYLKASTKTNVMIGIEDNHASCACGNCDSSNPTNDYIQFLNDVDEELQTRNLGRTITLYSMAYWKYLEAPTTVVCNENVGVVICYTWMDNTTTLDDETSTVNTEYFNRLKAWSAKTDNLGAWFYQTNYIQYFFPLNNYKTLIDNYNIVHEYGTDIIVNTGIADGEKVQSHFSAFKTYINSRTMRDLSVTYEELEADFFGFTKSGDTIIYNDNGYYGSAAAAEIMHTYYLELVTYLDTLTGTDKHGTLQEDIANGHHWTWDILTGWESDINTALALYANDTDSVYYKHIFTESLFPKYAKLTLFAERIDTFNYWVVKSPWTQTTWETAREQFKADCSALELEYCGEGLLIETWLL